MHAEANELPFVCRKKKKASKVGQQDFSEYGNHLYFQSYFSTIGYFSLAKKLKHLPAMWETWVRSLGQEEPLEKEMATHSRILAWRMPWLEESGGLQSMGSQRVGYD